MKNSKELTRTESRRICLFLLNTAIITGIAAGAFTTVSAGNEYFLSNPWLHQFFSPVCSGNTLLRVFLNTFFASGAFVVTEFLLGFVSFGQPAGIALLILRGIGIGSAAAQLYMTTGLGAVPVLLILIVPKAFAVSFITSLGAREMLKLSNVQFRFLFMDELPEEKMKRNVKLYCFKFFVLILILLVMSAIDSAMNYLFMDLL